MAKSNNPSSQSVIERLDATRRLHEMSPTQSLQIQFLKLATMVTRPMREFVAIPNNLTIDHIKLLLCLGDRGALTGREIADLVALSTMSISRAIAYLEELGWVERQVDPSDKRRRPVALSARGLEGHASIMPMIGQLADLIFGDFSRLEQVALYEAMVRIEQRLTMIGSASDDAEEDRKSE